MSFKHGKEQAEILDSKRSIEVQEPPIRLPAALSPVLELALRAKGGLLVHKVVRGQCRCYPSTGWV